MTAKVPTTSSTDALIEDSFRYSPLEHVRSLFVGFFQGLFHAAPRGAYHWEPLDDQSEIYISDESPVHGETLGQRPGISCTRGPVQFYSLGLDDMMSYDFRTGTKKKSVLVPGTMIVNCSSRVPLECERIAWICAEQLWLHRELLLKAGFFEIGRQPAIGAPSPAGSLISADSGDEWYVVSVTCPFQFYRTSQTSPLGKQIVHDMRLCLTTRLPRVEQQYARLGGHGGAMNAPGADLPVGLEAQRPDAFAPRASDVYGGTPQVDEEAPELQVVPHPLNPAQMVTVRASKPNSPAVRPPGMGGRPIPIVAAPVKESRRNQTPGCALKQPSKCRSS